MLYGGGPFHAAFGLAYSPPCGRPGCSECIHSGLQRHVETSRRISGRYIPCCHRSFRTGNHTSEAAWKANSRRRAGREADGFCRGGPGLMSGHRSRYGPHRRPCRCPGCGRLQRRGLCLYPGHFFLCPFFKPEKGCCTWSDRSHRRRSDPRTDLLLSRAGLCGRHAGLVHPTYRPLTGQGGSQKAGQKYPFSA